MDLCYDLSLCYIFSLYEGAEDGTGGYPCRIQVPVKNCYFLVFMGGGLQERECVLTSSFGELFNKNTSRYVTLSGGMCNLEVEAVCAQNLLHFTTFPSD